MLRILLSSFLASSLLSAVTIDELVKNSFEKNYDLKSLNKSIKVFGVKPIENECFIEWGELNKAAIGRILK